MSDPDRLTLTPQKWRRTVRDRPCLICAHPVDRHAAADHEFADPILSAPGHRTVSTAGLLAVVFELADRAKNSGTVFAAVDFLELTTGQSERTVTAILNRLRATGYLHRTRKGVSGRGRVSRASEWTLTDPSTGPDPTFTGARVDPVTGEVTTGTTGHGDHSCTEVTTGTTGHGDHSCTDPTESTTGHLVEHHRSPEQYQEGNLQEGNPDKLGATQNSTGLTYAATEQKTQQQRSSEPGGGLDGRPPSPVAAVFPRPQRDGTGPTGSGAVGPLGAQRQVGVCVDDEPPFDPEFDPFVPPDDAREGVRADG